MKDKDAYAVMGFLLTDSLAFYTENIFDEKLQKNNIVKCLSSDYTHYLRGVFASYDPVPLKLRENMLNYLRNLDMPYSLVMRVLKNEVGSFYHIANELAGEKEIFISEYRSIEVDAETGRIGIYCDMDGFVAWLDEYNQEWANDNQTLTTSRKEKKLFDELIFCKDEFSINYCYDEYEHYYDVYANGIHYIIKEKMFKTKANNELPYEFKLLEEKYKQKNKLFDLDDKYIILYLCNYNPYYNKAFFATGV